MAKVLILATNYGTWGEELQAPWDIIKKAGHEVKLATWFGKKPLPLQVSCDPNFFDPIIKANTNPPDVCARIKALTDGSEWANPLKFKDANMKDFDALVLTGGLGAMIDLVNNYNVHKLIKDALAQDKLVAALCYSVSALVFARDDKTKNSVIYGKTVTAHPASWDFYGPDWDFTYDLYGASPDNNGTNVHTPGFLWPLEHLVRDAVGPKGRCIAMEKANRENPKVAFDWPFVTGTSVESSIEYGKRIVEVLDALKKEGKAGLAKVKKE